MTILQGDFSIPKPSYPTVNLDLSANQVYLYIFLDGAVLLLLLFFLVFLIRLFLKKSSLIPFAFQKKVLLVTIPKEALIGDKEETIDQIKAQVAIAEGWLSTLGGMRAQRGITAWLFGRNDQFSLEIVADRGLISFYVVVPNYLRDYMEHQLLAQYPEAALAEAQDYNIFSPQGKVVCAYLKFSRDYVLPLKTFQKFNVDPLNAIANALSRVAKEDGVVIQIIARSAKKRWHKRGERIAREMQKGKNFNEALIEIEPFSALKLFNLFTPKTKTDEKEAAKPTPPLSQMQQESILGIEQKTSKGGLDCNIRIVASAQNRNNASAYLKSVVESFSQFNFYQYGNSFKTVLESPNKLINDFIYRNYREYQKMLLNSEELASIYHLPTPFLDTPNIRWLLAKKLPPPVNLPSDGILLGENIYRGVKTNIYLKTDDRRRHCYIIGMTGTGKSVMLANMAIQDIRNGKGVCVIDPHGSLVESVLSSIPKERVEDVVYLNPADTERPIGLNMLEANNLEEQDFVIQEMIAIFYKLVTDPSMIGPMFEHNMRNAMLTLMADKNSPGTIVEIPRMFTDKNFQKYKLQYVTDPIVRAFWEQEMAKTTDFHKSEMLGYLISKVGRFIENAMMRNIIGQPRSGFNFRDVLDKQKILLVNLNKGRVGEVNSNLLGLIAVAKLQMAAFSRVDLPENQRPDFYVYIDEFQNFITDSISTILAEARKYRLNLNLAHQYIGQLVQGTNLEGKSYGSKIKDAIFGNVGTIISFRIGIDDSEVIAKQMTPIISEYDLMNIEKYNAYVRLLVDNQPTKAFNIRTFQPPKGDIKLTHDVTELSRWKHGSERQKVESDILKRSQLGAGTTAIAPPIERSL
ncbi:MAG: type IV secretion system DNA-binding domain-containing protein [Candidatus Magasanikbacteria bacterium]|nr:type IV secretion system DNA-binding domain-containing protein [Candidatus Magasanikbacteria bacterium]